jgi:DNA-binding SARP family transcriptional activator
VRAGDAGGSREVSWPLKKALRVFTYLASSPELEASREELVEAVWGDEDDAAVERNFHPTLSHLRRALTRALPGLPPPLQLRGGSYRLSPAIDWRIDVVEFDALLKRGRQRHEAGDASAAIEHWQAAWRLYGGPFLAGEHGDWVSERREALLQSYVELLRGLGETLLESGELQRAMDAYRSLLIADRLQERAHVAMMRIYARLARRDLVRRQYDRLSELLRDELGVEPLAETTAEYHRLMG